MERFFENVFSGIGITDIVDILIVAFVIYKLLGLIKQTRAEQLTWDPLPVAGLAFQSQT